MPYMGPDPCTRAAKRRTLSPPSACEPAMHTPQDMPPSRVALEGDLTALAPLRRLGTEFRPAMPTPLSREFGTCMKSLQSMPPLPTSPRDAWLDDAARGALPAESVRHRLLRHFSPGVQPEGPNTRFLVRHS